MTRIEEDNTTITHLRQFISGRQTAYLVRSSQGVLFFYKRSDTIVKYYLPDEIDLSKVSVAPIAQKNDFMVYYGNEPESSNIGAIYHLTGIDTGPVRANQLYQDTRYAILKPTWKKEKYYIVNNKGYIEHFIHGYVDCEINQEPKYLFDVYFIENFIVILHKSGILLYNIPRARWWPIEINNIDFCNCIHEYYYIKKCHKLVFVLLCESGKFNYSVIVLKYCIIIDLKRIEAHLDKYNININIKDYITIKDIMSYIENTYGDWLPYSNILLQDYSLDTNEGVLYLILSLEDYEIEYIAMECSLCDNTCEWK